MCRILLTHESAEIARASTQATHHNVVVSFADGARPRIQVLGAEARPPPSAIKTVPVTNEASSEAANKQHDTISDGWLRGVSPTASPEAVASFSRRGT